MKCPPHESALAEAEAERLWNADTPEGVALRLLASKLPGKVDAELTDLVDSWAVFNLRADS
jgi:hypothetical protein